MIASLVGPLAVETYIDTAAAKLVLRHAGGDLSFSIVDPTGTLKHIRPFLPATPTLVKAEPPAPARCEAEGCGRLLVQPARGRKRHFCNSRCSYRARQDEKLRAESAPVPRSRLLRRMDEQLGRGAA